MKICHIKTPARGNDKLTFLCFKTRLRYPVIWNLLDIGQVVALDIADVGHCWRHRQRALEPCSQQFNSN